MTAGSGRSVIFPAAADAALLLLYHRIPAVYTFFGLFLDFIFRSQNGSAFSLAGFINQIVQKAHPPSLFCGPAERLKRLTFFGQNVPFSLEEDQFFLLLYH